MSYWNHRKPVRRARAVDVHGAARAAVEVLDEGGLRALTARAVAGRLGVAPASLYSRVESVDDLFDLALDAALGDDVGISRAIAEDGIDALMLAYFRHLVRHRWACQVIAMRPPRGPHYLRLSERLVVLLVEEGAADPLANAYTLSNFVIGSATTAHVAGSEPEAPVDGAAAPTYSALHRQESGRGAEQAVVMGLAALRKSLSGN
ncbi:TetR/AcrR family transcriptional regulator [Brevibacterium linens]|uniref:Regulatory protein TetR n=1 Tax=Brevibacterium linens TaxID=1703 RepID=A0A0B9A8B1_BRELN|nr:TetR/AcrR family transcriptional regulator C-terminal domain-containing protein [Brevibacterium linens]KHS51691.1 regulatory protein TetR [Brevibacterium linens]